MMGLDVSRAFVQRCLKILILFVAILAAFIFATMNKDVYAHEASDSHGGIQLTPTGANWSEDGEQLEVNFRIVDEHSLSISRPDNKVAWSYRWFSYDYVQGSEFNCSSEYFGISQFALEGWLEENNYGSSIYEAQEGAFATGSSSFARVTVLGDGSYEGKSTIRNKEDITSYVGGVGELAVCFEIKYRDGTHAFLSKIVLDFSNLANSQGGDGTDGTSATTGDGTTTARPVDDTSTAAGGAGSGSPATPSSTPNTGIVEGVDNNLIFAIFLSMGIVVSLTLIKIRQSAKKHHQ